ncbi:Uma2 family endonuclease [Sphingomonas sp. S1-29]|uniref:Uma2 family endonuclease n=1 Tax=Sphingomonas sp. S1-29 TaxID=2991074 RepID=UPI00223F76EA|nr:Uma2 family endonuclease [Sphingomonas sp. S1-29]UZK68195.1 Uma2 family endonuclease [Sphingomonas sp. S1-29]
MTVFQNIQRGLIPARLTVEEVYALTESGVLREGERFELIDGEIVPMAAAKYSHHERMKSRLVRAFNLSVARDIGVFIESSVTLDGSTLTEPDIALWPAHRDSEDVRGPELLLVVEIAASSIGYDLRVKAPLYGAHGVREYWVVDAVRQTIRVHRAPAGGSYTDVAEYEAHDPVTASLLPGISVRLDSLD